MTGKELAVIEPRNDIIDVGPLEQALQAAVEAGNVEGMKDVRAIGEALRKGAQARGLGIEQENKASEVVLRAERAIGLLLLGLVAEGRFGDDARKRALQEAALGRKVVGRIGKGNIFAELGKLSDRVDWFLSNDDLGVTKNESMNFQRLASIPDDRFEAMIEDVRKTAKRIAKVNFYRPVDREREQKREHAETPSEPGFDLFRRGAFLLLGWKVDDEGNGRPTANRVQYLASDELRQFAKLMQHLAAAYGEARSARG